MVRITSPFPVVGSPRPRLVAWLITGLMCVGWLFGNGFPGGEGTARAAEPPSFRAAVAPLLVDTCLPCHHAKKAEGGYRLDTFEQLRLPGDSGAAPLVAGPEPGGELLRRIEAEDVSERMPPEAPPVPREAVAAVRGWLAAGAVYDGARPSEPLVGVVPPRTRPAPPRYPQPVPVTAVAFSPDGGELFVGGYHELLVFDTGTGSLVRRLGGVGQRATAIRFLDRGETVVVAGGEPGRAGDVRLLEARTGAVRRVLARSTDVICDVAVRPGSTELAAAGADGLLRIVDAATGDEVRTLSSHGDWVTAVAYSDDGGRLASASRDKTVKVFDAAGGELVATFGGHASAVRGVALSADGRQGFSVGDDKRLLRWNADDGKAIGNPVALGGEGLRLVRDGERVFVPTGGKSVAAVELGSGKVVPVPHADWPLCVAVHTETGRLASGSLDGEVRLFTLQDGALVRAWPARP